MSQPSRAQLKRAVWIAVASQMAKLSTCLRAQVGCVLLRADGSVAGTGYNGSLPGRKHCESETCNPSARCLRTRHAERSALDYSSGPIHAAYVTHEPCLSCVKDLLARGCEFFYFAERYPTKDPIEAASKRVHLIEAMASWILLAPDGALRGVATATGEYLCWTCFDAGCDDCGFLPVLR